MSRDYAPLGTAADFPADPEGIRDYGDDLAATAALIAEQAEALRAMSRRDNWDTDSADAFRDRAEDLAGKISRAEGRYTAVAAHLRTVSDDLADYERRAAGLAGSAQVQEHLVRSNPPARPEPQPDGPPEISPAGHAQNARRARAQAELARLHREYGVLVQSARDTADAAAGRIRGALDDAVKDDWWDRNAGWLKTAGQVLGAIAAVAGLILLVVATGGLAFAIALGVALVAGALAAAASIGLAAKADGSWTQAAIDVVGVLSLGAGGLALRALSRGFPAVRGAVAGLRAAAAHSASMHRLFGLPLRFHTWRAGWSVNLLGGRSASLAALGRMGDEAASAAQAARQATLAPFPVTRVQAFLDGGRDTSRMVRQIREMQAGVGRLDDVPAEVLDGLSRLDVLRRIAVHAPNIGAVTMVGGIAAELPKIDATSAVELVTDLIGRLR